MPPPVPFKRRPDPFSAILPALMRSPLLRVCHPTVEQAYEKAVRIHANLQSFFAPRRQPRKDPPPTLEEVRRSHQDEPIRPLRPWSA